MIGSAAPAQDERRVFSPDGQLEFRLFVNSQTDTNLSRVAYRVQYRGKALIEPSFLGFDLYTQEPLLGENVGLTSESQSANETYHTLTARYLQNGSLGRRLDVEVRVYDAGIAFRYVIGTAATVDRLQIADETTEFALPHDPATPLGNPFVTERKDVAWVAITEVPLPGFPVMHLANEDRSANILLTRLTRTGRVPDVVYDGAAPLTSPWRVILVAQDRRQLLQNQLLQSLPKPAARN